MRAAGPVTIAPAVTADDLAAVAALLRDYAAGLDIDLGYQGFAAELAELPGRYAPPLGALLLAREGGRAVGCVALRPLDGVCEMKRLFVTPAARGTGLGRALVAEILQAARRIGYGEIRLDTLPSMAGALAVYRQAGFRPTPAYYDTPVAGTVFLAARLAAPPASPEGAGLRRSQQAELPEGLGEDC